MGAEQVPGQGGRYHLVAFDARGEERPEATGPYSQEIAGMLAREAATDVFVLSHGWMGDVPAARRQYGAWLAAMAGCPDDEAAAQARPRGFRPVVVAVHWPSKAWADEDLGPASFAVPGPEAAADGTEHAAARLVESTAAVLQDGPVLRDAVRTIVAAALEDPIPAILPVEV